MLETSIQIVVDWLSTVYLLCSNQLVSLTIVIRVQHEDVEYTKALKDYNGSSYRYFIATIVTSTTNYDSKNFIIGYNPTSTLPVSQILIMPYHYQQQTLPHPQKPLVYQLEIYMIYRSSIINTKTPTIFKNFGGVDISNPIISYIFQVFQPTILNRLVNFW
ncbi:hypothetical protein ACTFIV_002795 [Dictyostelium citrinum]